MLLKCKCVGMSLEVLVKTRICFHGCEVGSGSSCRTNLLVIAICWGATLSSKGPYSVYLMWTETKSETTVSEKDLL